MNLGKKPNELTVVDILGTLEPEKNKKLLRMTKDTHEEEVRANLKKIKQKINKLAKK